MVSVCSSHSFHVKFEYIIFVLLSSLSGIMRLFSGIETLSKTSLCSFTLNVNRKISQKNEKIGLESCTYFCFCLKDLFKSSNSEHNTHVNACFLSSNESAYILSLQGTVSIISQHLLFHISTVSAFLSLSLLQALSRISSLFISLCIVRQTFFHPFHLRRCMNNFGNSEGVWRDADELRAMTMLSFASIERAGEKKERKRWRTSTSSERKRDYQIQAKVFVIVFINHGRIHSIHLPCSVHCRLLSLHYLARCPLLYFLFLFIFSFLIPSTSLWYCCSLHLSFCYTFVRFRNTSIIPTVEL